MRKIWAITSKELISTFTDRTLVTIMIVTPLLVSTIIALAFGGGGDPDAFSINEIPIAIVNLDEGLNLADMVGNRQLDGTAPAESLFDFFQGDDTVDGAAAPFNAGAALLSILAPENVADGGDAPAIALPACTMVVDAEAGGGFDTTLDTLFAPTVLDDPAAARAAVESGAVVAAIIIPPGFSDSVLPLGQFGPPSRGSQPDREDASEVRAIEVYANAGNAIEANVVRSVVEGVVGQFGRMGIAILGLGDTVGQSLASAELDMAGMDLNTVPAVDAPASEWQRFLSDVSGRSPWFAVLAGTLDQLVAERAQADAGQQEPGLLNGEIGGAIACLFEPNAGAVLVRRQPLNELQEQSYFEQVMVQVGSAQAVFFALFTGAFGILGIYQERKQWTLQRMLVSPTPRSTVLGGFLSGNVVVVWAQLLLLMFFLTLISSVIIRQPTVIWGDQWLLLLLLTVVISLCVSGLGVLIVGVARTPEQVQVFAPVINIFLGALGGSFGFRVPPALASLSLITWATDAYHRLAAGQSDIGLNLAVLALQGILFFGVGLWLFRKRVAL